MYVAVFDFGVFVLFLDRSILLPGLRSRMGRAAEEARKTSIFSVFHWVQPRTSYRSRCAENPASSLANLLKMRRLWQVDLGFWRSGFAFLVAVGVKLALFVGVEKCRELREDGVLVKLDGQFRILSPEMVQGGIIYV